MCDRCGSSNLQRIFSSFRMLRAPLDPSTFSKGDLLDGVNYTDPGSMAPLFRCMQDAFQDGPNEHMDEIVERLDHGEAIEKALDLDTRSHGDPASSDEN